MSPSAGGSGDASGGLTGVPAVGEVIAAKYQVERVLGVGGMGVVVAARHLQLGQRVAIKFMRSAIAQDGNAAARFLREARAAVALTSQHAAKVIDVGTLDSGAPYMVMEYLAGVDLGEVLHRDGPLPVVEAVGAVLQACEAIAEAHALGIVHRDLKPTNLFVTAHTDGTPLVKVLDFGISKTLGFNSSEGDQGLTASGSVMGSPRYMSPEQARNAKAVDRRSDIWALGVILYELLTGVEPFAGETLGETLAKILSDSPPPVNEIRPDVPEALAAVIAQCLLRKLGDRVQTVADLADKLAPFASPSALLSVERIQRIARGRAGPTIPSEDESASNTMTAVPLSDSRRGSRPSRPAAHESAPAWLKSGGASRDAFRAQRIARTRIVVFAAISVLGLAGAGAFAFFGHASASKSTAGSGPGEPASASARVQEEQAAKSAAKPVATAADEAPSPPAPTPAPPPVEPTYEKPLAPTPHLAPSPSLSKSAHATGAGTPPPAASATGSRLNPSPKKKSPYEDL
jgi:serine/threonine-protein kinase